MPVIQIKGNPENRFHQAISAIRECLSKGKVNRSRYKPAIAYRRKFSSTRCTEERHFQMELQLHLELKVVRI